MDTQSVQHAAWGLARSQHGVVSRAQLLALGLSAQAIKHRVRRGRLHPVARGIYAVGRRELTREGRWMAAVLTCGPNAVLSHGSAAALWRIGPEWRLEITIPLSVARHRPGIVIHRRRGLRATTHRGIPVTPVVVTLVDLAAVLGDDPVEAAINEADKLDLCDPERLRSELDGLPPWTGIKPLRRILDLRTFTMTDTELERRFLPIARRAGLPKPLTSTGSTASASTSSGRTSRSSSRPTACATTARRPSRPATTSATRSISPPAYDRCGSRARRSATSPPMSSGS